MGLGRRGDRPKIPSLRVVLMGSRHPMSRGWPAHAARPSCASLGVVVAPALFLSGEDGLGAVGRDGINRDACGGKRGGIRAKGRFFLFKDFVLFTEYRFDEGRDG